MDASNARRRVVVEAVSPEVDCGRFAIKRVIGDRVSVVADVFADGHDVIAATLAWRKDDPRGRNGTWSEAPMEALGNDRWRGSFTVDEMGRYLYTIRGWIDRFGTWTRDLRKRVDAGQDVTVEMQIGAGIVEAAAKRTVGPDAEALLAWAERLLAQDQTAAFSEELAALVADHPETALAGEYPRQLPIVVDRPRARFSAWYEMFPRSAAPPVPGQPPRHGTFADVEQRLPYVASLGFDVLYLPPIHPIGRTNRKGRNNSTVAEPGDPGSPWAIGGPEGGHTAIHPDLGTIEDFDRLVVAAGRHGLEIALDVAYQMSPDHPWVTEHPEWFRRRPDGTLQYAENPPKRYEDIYPIDFETEAWTELWEALKGVVDYWIGHGVKIFRVDNPHTKPFAFWEWMIGEVKAAHPEVIFLAEAFTRPKVMYRLAKLGFTQSYTYFTWRSTKAELTEYLTELWTTGATEFFGPNLWPNTPDILAVQLQADGRPAFIARLVLAATLSTSYGIYGPVFEMGENTPVRPGSEEYLHSEKYEIRSWDLDNRESLSEIISRLNKIRRENAALQVRTPPVFHTIDNDQLIAYSKSTEDGSSVVLVIVNLDPHWVQSGWLDLPLEALGLPADRHFAVDDLLTGARFIWNSPRNFVQLDPAVLPAHILALRRPERTEADFNYAP
jgi:starch synthase (maltosyl-transferring)